MRTCSFNKGKDQQNMENSLCTTTSCSLFSPLPPPGAFQPIHGELAVYNNILFPLLLPPPQGPFNNILNSNNKNTWTSLPVPVVNYESIKHTDIFTCVLIDIPPY